MKKAVVLLCIPTMLIMFSCQPQDPNVNKSGENKLKSHEVENQIKINEHLFLDDIYVPIYSDIYVDRQNQNALLAATLSIRNTSYVDSLFVTKIDYFNTTGDLVRSYIENPIIIKPMGTINYVIEKEDDTGGPGANFIVTLSSKNADIRPVVQAVMIGETGNKGFAFSTDGYSLKKKNNK